MEDLTFNCPVCGADVPRRAKSCPECGACEKSGWSEDQYLDGLNLPDENFNYEEDTALEFGRGSRKTGKTGKQRTLAGGGDCRHRRHGVAHAARVLVSA